jgi:hypothetical protein
LSRLSNWGAIAILLLGCIACTTPAPEQVREIARLDHPPLREVSGIARSSHEGVFWVHNDSGDTARLFAITLDGKPVVPPHVEKRYVDTPWPGLTVLNASNVDWEDIVVSGDRLYIAEMGNNENDRRDLGVYELIEPDPDAATETRALRFLPVRYPDQSGYPGDVWHFDCEALFLAGGKLHFLTKHRHPGSANDWAPGTKLYRLDTDHTDRENVLTLVGERADINLPTAADLSPDGRRLAVLTYSTVWVFEEPGPDGNWLAAEVTGLALDRGRMMAQEAITWKDDRTLLIANEQRRLFEVDVAALGPID